MRWFSVTLASGWLVWDTEKQPKLRAGFVASRLWPFFSRYSNESAPTDLFGWVLYGEGLKQSRRKSPPFERWTVELALDLAGWKPALLDGGTDGFL